MFKLFALAALVASASAAGLNKTAAAKLAIEKLDIIEAKEALIEEIEHKINATKFMVKEAEDSIKGASLKADVMDKLAGSMKAVNLTKLKELKEYDATHPALPKANLTLAKPVMKLDILKPNKTALKMEIEHMIVKGSKTNY